MTGPPKDESRPHQEAATATNSDPSKITDADVRAMCLRRTRAEYPEARRAVAKMREREAWEAFWRRIAPVDDLLLSRAIAAVDREGMP